MSVLNGFQLKREKYYYFSNSKSLSQKKVARQSLKVFSKLLKLSEVWNSKFECFLRFQFWLKIFEPFHVESFIKYRLSGSMLAVFNEYYPANTIQRILSSEYYPVNTIQWILSSEYHSTQTEHSSIHNHKSHSFKLRSFYQISFSSRFSRGSRRFSVSPQRLEFCTEFNGQRSIWHFARNSIP